MEKNRKGGKCISNRIIYLFLGGRGEASWKCLLLSPPPLRVLISESDYEIHNIILGNYSLHNYIKMQSRMHPIDPFLDNFGGKARPAEIHDNASGIY